MIIIVIFHADDDDDDDKKTAIEGWCNVLLEAMRNEIGEGVFKFILKCHWGAHKEMCDLNFRSIKIGDFLS